MRKRKNWLHTDADQGCSGLPIIVPRKKPSERKVKCGTKHCLSAGEVNKIESVPSCGGLRPNTTPYLITSDDSLYNYDSHENFHQYLHHIYKSTSKSPFKSPESIRKRYYIVGSEEEVRQFKKSQDDFLRNRKNSSPVRKCTKHSKESTFGHEIEQNLFQKSGEVNMDGAEIKKSRKHSGKRRSCSGGRHHSKSDKFYGCCDDSVNKYLLSKDRRLHGGKGKNILKL